MEPLEPSAKCNWSQRELFETRPGQPPADRLQPHLASCPQCRQSQEFDRRLANMLQTAPAPVTPGNLESRVRQLRRRRKALQGAVGVAAALLIGLGSLAIWSPRVSPMTGSRSVVVGPTIPAEREVWNDVVVLGSKVPVVPVPEEQAAWLAVLNEACEGRNQ